MKIRSLLESLRDEAEEFIRSWTFHPDQRLTGFDAAYKLWGCKPRGKLYRGFFFKHQAEYEKFKADTHEFTQMKTEGYSSWAIDFEQASEYAMLSNYYDEAGYGVVISAKVPLGTRVVNASKAERGEAEYLIEASTFAIKLEGEVKR